MKTTCPFCTIVKEERVLREGTHAYVIFSNPHLMPGHLLVIPKRHVERFIELTKEERDEIMDLTVEFEEKILKTLAPGCDIRQHHKPFAQYSPIHVDHMHVHLQPRHPKDELYQKTIGKETVYRPLPEKEREELTEIFLNDQ